MLLIKGSLILSGRTKLIEDERAQRFKIKTLDSNEIDTIFIDNRKKSPNGNTLVICSEGQKNITFNFIIKYIHKLSIIIR